VAAYLPEVEVLNFSPFPPRGQGITPLRALPILGVVTGNISVYHQFCKLRDAVHQNSWFSDKLLFYEMYTTQLNWPFSVMSVANCSLVKTAIKHTKKTQFHWEIQDNQPSQRHCVHCIGCASS